MLDRAVAHLADLIAFPTVSSDPNRALIDHAAGLLADMGARVRVQGDAAKANLIASFGPEEDGGLMLSGHTDVVPVEGQDWTRDPWTMTEAGGLLYGRGTADMKGFIACVLAALPGLTDGPLRRPLHIALTHDEEVGCLGAEALAALLAAEGPRPRLAIIGEPTGMKVIEGHKGCCEYRTEFVGLAGHGSNPGRGVNAVEYAARHVARLLALREELKARAPRGSRFEPPWSTLNIGRIAGGQTFNVIAERAEIDWDLRPVTPGDATHARAVADAHAAGLLAEMRAVHPGASITRHVLGEVAALTPMPQNEARRLAMALTGTNSAGVVSFGTEAGIFQELGLDCVVCGPGFIEQAHKPDEFIALDQMQACLTMLSGLHAHLR